MRLAGLTDVGRWREANEDNFFTGESCAGVCDGMGGAAAGEVASQLAVDTIRQGLDGATAAGSLWLATKLEQAITAANARIFSNAKVTRGRKGMGTTATIAAFMGDHLFLGQVGDSRAYILRGDRLVQVTRDQSLVNQLIESGQLTEEEAETFTHNNVILQALGTNETVQVDLTYVQLFRGDIMMLCSDGLNGMIRDTMIYEALRANDDPSAACQALIDRANQAGGKDNITVVVGKFDNVELDRPSREDINNLKYQKYTPNLLLREGTVQRAARLANRRPAS